MTDTYDETLDQDKRPKKVVACIPTMTRPLQETLDATRDALLHAEESGWLTGWVNEIGCPYISAARATMLRKALDAKATVVVFIDHDVSFPPEDFLKLIEAEGDVVAGTYRFKMDREKYMGEVLGPYPMARDDGAVKMEFTPAGFLKVTRTTVNALMVKYPELVYGEPCYPHLDLFNHGAFNNSWFGEDAAFCRRWREIGGDIWCIPTLRITHHTKDKAYAGTFHDFLRRRPGGDLSDHPVPPEQRLKQPTQ